MSQDDTPDLAAPSAVKVAPEAVALRAQPRPVTRLNRRTLAILVGGLSVAVLGATIWSLQPQRRGVHEQTERYNVDRVSKSEGLDGLPADYSKLPPKVPELGPPTRRPATTRMTPCAKRRKPLRLRRCSSARAAKPPPRWRRRRRVQQARSRRLTRSPPGRLRRRPNPPTQPPCRTGKIRTRRS